MRIKNFFSSLGRLWRRCAPVALGIVVVCGITGLIGLSLNLFYLRGWVDSHVGTTKELLRTVDTAAVESGQHQYQLESCVATVQRQQQQLNLSLPIANAIWCTDMAVETFKLIPEGIQPLAVAAIKATLDLEDVDVQPVICVYVLSAHRDVAEVTSVLVSRYFPGGVSDRLYFYFVDDAEGNLRPLGYYNVVGQEWYVIVPEEIEPAPVDPTFAEEPNFKPTR